MPSINAIVFRDIRQRTHEFEVRIVVPDQDLDHDMMGAIIHILTNARSTQTDKANALRALALMGEERLNQPTLPTRQTVQPVAEPEPATGRHVRLDD